MTIGRNALRGSLFAILVVTAAAARPPAEVAKVPQTLIRDPAYNQYARILVQIDLLAKPASASLPIAVSMPEAGLLALTGSVTSEKLKRQILSDARRISGLLVRDELAIEEVPQDYIVRVTAEQLEQMTQDALATLFSDCATSVEARVGEGGVVILNGSVPSHETRLLLSQAIKSEPGCRAVVNLLQVAPNEASGTVQVSENGALRVPAEQLPRVPPAPIVEVKVDDAGPSVRSITARSFAGDDAPDADLFARQLKEDVLAQLEGEPKLAGEEFTIDAHDGAVTISTELKKRELVELAVSAAIDVPGVRHVVVKGKPFTILRRNPPKVEKRFNEENDEAETQKAEKPTKLLGFLPSPWADGKDANHDNPTVNRRLKEIVRRSIKRRCDKRIDKLAVRPSLGGLVIEADVASARDRGFVLSQVEQITELRNVPYDVVLRVKEF